MIGITFALPSESSDFRRRISRFHREADMISGKINDVEVAAVHTGVGAKHCNSRLELLLHKTRPRFVISSGFAGAIGEELRAGDLILAQNFSDPKLLYSARRILAGHKARMVKLFTAASIADSVPERNEIARRNGADAVDMETETIAKACAAHEVPLLSLRAISDSLRDPFPAPPRILFDLERQRTRYVRLLFYLLIHPGAISGLIRFARHIDRARDGLTTAILDLVRAL